VPKNKEPAEDVEDEVLDETPPETTETTDDSPPSEDVGGEETASTEPPPSFLSRLGGEFADLDEDSAATRIQERLRAAEQAEQERRFWAYQAQTLQQQQAQQQAQWQAHQQQQAQAAQSQSAWKAPEYDPGWLSMVKRDEAGNLVAINGADPTLPSKIQAYANWKSQQEQEFWKNPGDFAWGQIQPKLDQYVSQQVQQAIQQDRLQREVDDWAQAHSKILFDANNQPTPIGRRIAQHAQALGGQAPPKHVWDAAWRIVHGEMAIERAQRPEPAKVNGDKKMDLLRRGAVQKRNRDGTFTSARPETRREVNTKIPLEERMKQAFAEAGVSDGDFN
jgi:hypothetical protein